MDNLYYNEGNKQFETASSLQALYREKLEAYKRMLKVSYNDWECTVLDEGKRGWTFNDKMQLYLTDLNECQRLMNLSFNEWLRDSCPSLIEVSEPDAKMAAGMLRAMDTASYEFFKASGHNATDEEQAAYDEVAEEFYKQVFTIRYDYAGGSHEIKLHNDARTWSAIEEALQYIITQQ